MNKFGRILVRTVCIPVFGFLAVCLLFTELHRGISDFDFSGRTFVGDYVHNLPLLLLGAALLASACYVHKRKTSQRAARGLTRRELTLYSAILLILQATLAYHIYLWAGTDTSVLRLAASHFAEGRWDPFYNLAYFQMCPNNLLLYGVNVLFVRLGQLLSVNGFLLLLMFGILLVNLAVLLTALTVYRMTDDARIARITYLVSALFFGLSPWIVVPYSDTLSILSPVLTLYLYVRTQDSPLHPYKRYAIVFIVPAVLYFIKPTNAIIAIAIAAIEILSVCGAGKERRKTDGVWKTVGCMAAALVTVFALAFGVNRMTAERLGYRPDDAKRLPVSYFLVLGSNYETYGIWNQEDVDRMSEGATQSEKNRAAAEIIDQRLRRMGAVGVADHWKNKVHLFYNDATFGWGVAGGFFDVIPEEANDSIAPFLRNLFYPYPGFGLTSVSYDYGSYFAVYAVGVQAVWIPILFLGFLLPFLPDRRQEKSAFALSVAMVGIFWFDMLFETSARLMYSQLPLFVTAAMASVGNLFRLRCADGAGNDAQA